MKKAAFALAVAALLAAGPASAHHSAAMFDSSKLVILKGTMLSFSNMNPHAWLSVQVPDAKGKSDRWDVEATAPGLLAMQGIHSDTLKTGDKVTVGIRPLRDGRRAGSLVFVVTADGVARGAKLTDLGLDAAKLKP